MPTTQYIDPKQVPTPYRWIADQAPQQGVLIERFDISTHGGPGQTERVDMVIFDPALGTRSGHSLTGQVLGGRFQTYTRRSGPLPAPRADQEAGH